MEIDMSTLDNLSEQAIAFAWIVVPQILLALLTYLVGAFVIKIILKSITKVFSRYEIEPSLATFLTSMVKVVLYLLLVLAVLSSLGVEVTAFIAVLGAAGLAIGLALQGSLSNFAGGVLILIFKPFRVGDSIEAQGTIGEVEAIDILYTTIRNFDNKVVTVPNGELANNPITNLSLKPTRRVDMSVGVAYGTDLKKTREIILGTLKKDERIHKNPEPVVYFTTFGDSSLDLSVRCWSNVGDLWPVYWDNMEAIKETLEIHNIEVPFPQRDVNHHYPEGKIE